MKGGIFFSIFCLNAFVENFNAPSSHFYCPTLQTQAHPVVIYSIIHTSINIKVFSDPAARKYEKGSKCHTQQFVPQTTIGFC